MILFHTVQATQILREIKIYWMLMFKNLSFWLFLDALNLNFDQFWSFFEIWNSQKIKIRSIIKRLFWRMKWQKLISRKIRHKNYNISYCVVVAQFFQVFLQFVNKKILFPNPNWFHVIIFQDEEEDIRIRVESMFNGSNEDSDDEVEDEEEMDTGCNSPSGSRSSGRKRKQFLGHNRKNSHATSPTASPSKRPRKLKSPIASNASGNTSTMSWTAPARFCQNNTTSPALDLLETKKKVQRNSLYHWVLWREALRGEKDRVQGSNITRRLSFNWWKS